MPRALRWVSLALLIGQAAPAEASSWIYQDAESNARESKLFRFSPRLNFWVANFDRPPRACRAGPVGFPTLELRAEQLPTQDFFCASQSSDELAFGSGLEFGFRALGPIYLTAGLDFVYTAPDSSAIKNQLVIALPFGVMFTWYEWRFRPIAHFEITPVLYVTDDSRDYTLGGNAGFAYRILDFGSISLTAGYMWADTMTAWQVQLGLHPIL